MKSMMSKIKRTADGFNSPVTQTIIVGGNEVSIQLAERLTQLGQNIVIIADESAQVKQIQERLDALVLQGRGTNLDLLRQAGVSNTDLVIAITNNDQYNLLTGIYARELGVDRVVVQIKDRQLFDHQLQLDNLKLDLILNPFMMTVKQIKELIRPGVGPELKEVLGKKINISKFRVSHQSDFVYQLVSELELDEDTLLLAVLRKGRAIIPEGNDKLYPGDVLYIISKQTLKGKLGKLIKYGSSQQKNKLFLVGGGEINYQLAQSCGQEAVITLIEKDKEKCAEIVEQLSDVLVLNGTGTDLDLLKEEGITKADTFVASTEDDEANLLMANLADNLGVKSTVAVVSDISYSSLHDLLPVDHIISPALLAVDTILDYLHRGQVEENTVFAGQIKVKEIKVKQRKRQTIKNLNLPANILIGLIHRQKEIIIPGGETKLEQGDRLIIFSLPTKRNIESYF